MILQCIYWISGLVFLGTFLVICERIVRKRYCPACELLTANTVISPWAFYFDDKKGIHMKLRREVKSCSHCGKQYLLGEDRRPSSHKEVRKVYAV